MTLGVLVGACRKPHPDEIVYTGAERTPESGATGGSGAFASGGSAGTVGATPSGGRDGREGSAGESSTGGRDEAGGGGGVDSSDAGAGGEAGTPDPGPACDPVPVGSGAFTKRALLEAAAACVTHEYCVFQEHAKALRDVAAAAASGPSDEASAATRAAWMTAMATWQEAEVMLYGPAAPSLVPGGGNLRNLVYSWPLVARCKVDEQTVNKFYERESFLGPESASASAGRTLRALEYLLFYPGTDNGCTAYSTINQTGSWSRLSAGDIRQRKLDYSARAAEDVLRQADVLVEAWSPDGDDFLSKFVEPGAVYESEQAALNVVGGALFYVDKQLKDSKLAKPLGLDPTCPSASCPDSVEAPFAKTSVDHIARNLRGFRKLFQGCAEGNAGIGFDDWLIAIDRADLAERMLAALDGADAALTTLDQPLETLVVTDPARVRVVYDAVKRITDPLKTEFVSALNLELPEGSEGDND